MDHFGLERISKRKLLTNLKEYSTNSSVGKVMDVTNEFVILQNSRSAFHDSIAGMATLKSAIRSIRILRNASASKNKASGRMLSLV